MTPYDVAAVRLGDGTVLAGTPPDDAPRYLQALRADRSARAAALGGGDVVSTAQDVVELVERLAQLPWTEAQTEAQAAGALVGAYPVAG